MPRDGRVFKVVGLGPRNPQKACGSPPVVEPAEEEKGYTRDDARIYRVRFGNLNPLALLVLLGILALIFLFAYGCFTLPDNSNPVPDRQ